MTLPGLYQRHSDLPLEGDATTRFLPWLIAPMVFLCAVSLAGVFILNTLIGRWDHDVSGTLTVEVAAAPGDAAASAAQTQKNVDDVVRLLNETPGVEQARALSQEQLAALLAPWLGNTDLLKELPLPALVDVTVRSEARPDLSDLSQKLAAAVPGVSLDDHRAWLARLIGISRSIEWFAVAIVAVIGGVTSATVVYATRTGMAVHQDVIEVLHLIGATDDYIARQFADRAFVLGLRGGLFGLGMTIPAIALLSFSAHQMEGGFLSGLALPVIGWIAVLVLPMAAALVSMFTARVTVHTNLARMT